MDLRPGELVKCNTCYGEYAPILRDGTQYFHACPPFTLAELQAAIADGRLTLTRDQATRRGAAAAADQKNPPPAGELTREDRYLLSLGLARPEARDENVIAPIGEDGRPAIKAEGRGVTRIEA